MLNVENDAEVQSTLQNLIGTLRVPVVTIGDIVVNGFNRAELSAALKEKNYPITLSTEHQ